MTLRCCQSYGFRANIITEKKKNDVRYRICTGQSADDDCAPTVHSVLLDNRRLSSGQPALSLGHSFRTRQHFFCTPRQSVDCWGKAVPHVILFFLRVRFYAFHAVTLHSLLILRLSSDQKPNLGVIFTLFITLSPL